jgi:ATP phosphoribosyltransferase
VDIVDTGNTLKANGLAQDEFIADISSRLVASRLALKMKDETIKPLVALLAAAIKRNSEQA